MNEEITRDYSQKPQTSVDIITDCISVIQRTVIHLEKESASAKEKAEFYQAKYNETMSKYDETLDKYNKIKENYSEAKLIDLEDKARNLEELKNKINTLTQSIYDKDKQLDDSRNELSQLTGKLKFVSGELEEKKTLVQQYRDKNQELQDKLLSHDKEIEEIKNTYAKRDAEIEKLNNTIFSLERSIEEKQREIEREVEKNKMAADSNLEANKTISSLREENANLASELNTLKAKTSESAANSDDLIRVKRDYDDLSREKESIEHAFTNTKEKLAKKMDEIDELNKKIKTLHELAYFDKKTGVKNNNAFNEDFASAVPEEIILSFVGIKGMKDINERLGRAVGDKCISLVAKALMDKFPNSDIYRILGDQFAIISKNKTFNNIKGQFVDAHSILAHEQIVIYYGISVGSEIKKKAKMISKAEKDLMKMRDEDVASIEQDPMKQLASPDVVFTENKTENTGAKVLSDDELMALMQS